jgi:selenocysteine lyase/cysteine desulfurase
LAGKWGQTRGSDPIYAGSDPTGLTPGPSAHGVGGSDPTGLTPGVSARAEFPIFEHTVYANSCSQGALSNRVRAAAEEWLAGWDENGAEWQFWVERNEAARTAFAGLVHAEPDDVAVTTSVSQAVSALVSALDLSGARNRIVISEYEFPTVGQIAHAQELRGAEVVHVRPENDGRIPLERFAEAIDERTALVCCTALSFRSGHRHDVAAIAELGHASGAIVLADSYQAIGALELDVRALGADVITGGTVKYLLGSAGLAFMWIRESLRLQLLPTQTGWFADEDIFAMSIADYSPHASARRFDSGTPPVPSLYPGVAGMELIAEAGVPAIEAHVRGLVDRLLVGLDELGATIATSRGEREYGPLVCVVSTDPNALVAALENAGIVTSTRDSNLRISLHLYNVEDDVDRILAALAANRALLA